MTKPSIALCLVFVTGVMFAGEIVPRFSANGAAIWFALVFVLWCIGIVSAVTARMQRVRVILASVCVSLVCGHLLFGPIYYRSESIQSRVVVLDTRAPVVGATIRAEWILKTPGLEGSRTFGVFHEDEVTSGGDGGFTLPAWGPVLRPPFRYLDVDDPLIVITASNAAPLTENNAYHESVHAPRNPFSSARFCEWSRHELWLSRSLVERGPNLAQQ